MLSGQVKDLRSTSLSSSDCCSFRLYIRVWFSLVHSDCHHKTTVLFLSSIRVIVMTAELDRFVSCLACPCVECLWARRWTLQCTLGLEEKHYILQNWILRNNKESCFKKNVFFCVSWKKKIRGVTINWLNWWIDLCCYNPTRSICLS